MTWISYIIVTIVVYVINLFKLKGRTEQERIGSTPVFFNALIFFAIFEFFFLKSLFTHPFFHLFGLVFSSALAISIYVYLRNLKKDVEGIFYYLVEVNQGKISILTFMQRTQLSQEEATEFLEEKMRTHEGISYETLGNIYYEFDRW